MSDSPKKGKAYTRRRSGETKKHKMRRPTRNIVQVGYKEMNKACDDFMRSRGFDVGEDEGELE